MTAHAPLYVGELYFEGHRGTLTQQLPSSASSAPRSLPCAISTTAPREPASPARNPNAARLDELWRVLLLNQFHDILPGTSIPAVHDQAIRELTSLVADCRAYAGELLSKTSSKNSGRSASTIRWDGLAYGMDLADLPSPRGVASQRSKHHGASAAVFSANRSPTLGARVLEVGLPKRTSQHHFALPMIRWKLRTLS